MAHYKRTSKQATTSDLTFLLPVMTRVKQTQSFIYYRFSRWISFHKEDIAAAEATVQLVLMAIRSRLLKNDVGAAICFRPNENHSIAVTF